MRKILSSLLLSSICVVVAFATLCGGFPQWIAPSTYSPTPGSQVTFQVALNQAASGTQAVSITADNPSLFSSLPSTVYVQNGQTTATFQGTLASNASGSFTVVATANGVGVDCDVYIAEPPK